MFIGAQMMAKKIDKIKLVDLQRQDNLERNNWSVINHKQPNYSIGFISVLSYLNFLLHQVAWIDSIFIVIGIFGSYLVDDTLLSCIEIKR